MHKHTHTHTCTHAHTHARTHARTHACTHARTHAHMYARTYTRTHVRTYARTHAHTHIHARARTHTLTRAPTHNFFLSFLFPLSCTLFLPVFLSFRTEGNGLLAFVRFVVLPIRTLFADRRTYSSSSTETSKAERGEEGRVGRSNFTVCRGADNGGNKMYFNADELEKVGIHL